MPPTIQPHVPPASTTEVRPGEGRPRTQEVRPGEDRPAAEQPDAYLPSDASAQPVVNRADVLRAVHGGGPGTPGAGPGGNGPSCQAPPHEAGDTPTYTDDPSLDHNQRTCDPNLHRQPLLNADGSWDGGRILANVGQLDTTGQPGNQGSRCGAATLLGGAVMAGPAATARFTERLSTRVSDPAQQRELQGIRDRINDGTATNGDLSRVQEIAYNRYNTDGQWGLNHTEQNALHRDLAARATFDPIGGNSTLGGERQTDVQGVTAEQPGRTRERIDALNNGQSFTLFVDTDNPRNGPNHFVQIGRDQNGRTYAYDPLARSNQPHIIYQDQHPQAFNHYVNGSSGDTHPDISGPFNWVRGATVEY